MTKAEQARRMAWRFKVLQRACEQSRNAVSLTDIVRAIGMVAEGQKLTGAQRKHILESLAGRPDLGIVQESRRGLRGRRFERLVLRWLRCSTISRKGWVPTMPSLPPRPEPEPAITMPAAIRLPQRKQTHGAFPPSPSRPANESEPVAVRTIKLQRAATTFRCRHICQSASRRVRVQAQLINVMLFDVITLRNGKDLHCQVEPQMRGTPTIGAATNVSRTR